MSPDPAGFDVDGLLLVELGAAILGLALLSRLSDFARISPIPLYLLVGLALGRGGLAQLELSEDFVRTGAELGIVLLLLALGLEYGADDLLNGMRTGYRTGVLDAVANFLPGVLLALLLGWSAVAAVLLGGVTYISSSGAVAKLLDDLGRYGYRETPAILTILVIEDLAMAAYLPLMGVLLGGAGLASGLVSVSGAAALVVGAMYVAVRHGERVSRVMGSGSDETLLLAVLAATLIVAGSAQELKVSAAIGAFLVGLALSGPVSRRAAALVRPLRDLFAATFFLFFGLQTDPGQIPPVLLPAAVLAVVTGATKVATGWVAAARIGAGLRGRARAGTALVARGEFSIVIAGLGAAEEPELAPLAAAYVLILAVAGPVATRYAERFVRPSEPTSPLP